MTTETILAFLAVALFILFLMSQRDVSRLARLLEQQEQETEQCRAALRDTRALIESMRPFCGGSAGPG